MTLKTAITVMRGRAEVERLWKDPNYQRNEFPYGASVRFVDAPGDRGTEIHVAYEGNSPRGRIGEAVQKLRGALPRARVTDELRRFKQLVETGVVARSEAVPEGERVERKLVTRAAQPIGADEPQEVSA